MNPFASPFGFDRSFGTLFWITGILSVLFSLLFLGVFAFILVKLIGKWNKNNHSPRLTVPAAVTAKRTNVTRHRSAGESHLTHTSTTYYVTFQVESGDRMELLVSGSEYGMLAEGDTGKLTFQGSRYLGFERNI